MNQLLFHFALSLIVAAASASTWHVSERSLSSVPADRQFRTIQEAAKIAVAGDRVIIHSGVYRESIVIKNSGTAAKQIRFEAAPAANVVVTGLDQLGDWQKEAGGNIYSTGWSHRFIPSSKTEAHPDDDFHRLIGRAEQVVINGSALHQTLQRNQLSAGFFYVDLENEKLYVSPSCGEDLGARNSAVLVEAATRSILLDCKGDYVFLRGIHFRYASNPAQTGGVAFGGRADIAEDCSFERMNGAGTAFVGQNEVARHCVFQDNGQLGFAAYRAHNLLLTDCTIRNNNTKGFDRQWEAGGDKIVLSRGVTLEKCRFVANRGSGIWFDIGNENCTVRNCLIADNEDAGIFYEISDGLRAHDNVIIGNGFASTRGAWGAQAGIVLSSSPNCLITRNLLVGNREGFNFREQARITSRIDNRDEKQQEEIWNHNEQIRNNVIAYNRDAQVRGWFGVSDQRHWPRKLQEANPVNAAAPIPGVCLEALSFDLSDNLYAREDNQPLFVWGTNWLRHVDYSTIASIQSDLHLEERSRVVRLAFRNYAARDFRILHHTSPLMAKCYPRGAVPDVILNGKTR